MAASPRPLLRKSLASLFIALFSLTLVAGLYLPGFLDGLEGWAYNLRAQALAKPQTASEEIALILLDQSSLDWASQEMSLPWPWPREIYGLIFDFCSSGGAKAVAVDVVYTEPSVYGVDDDQRLASSVQNSGRVVSALTLFSGQSGSSSGWPQGYAERLPELSGREAWLQGKGRSSLKESASFNIPEFDRAAALHGSVVFDPDSDGIFRRLYPLSEYAGYAVPSLGLAAFVKGNPDQALGYGGGDILVGKRRIPLDSSGQALLRFRGPTGTHRAYNAGEVLQSAISVLEGKAPKLDPFVFKGKYVFFGFSATGLYDLRPSPMGKNYPGVEIHATFLDNLLTEGFLRETPKALALLAFFILALGSALALTQARKTWLQALFFVLFIPLPIALSFVLYGLGNAFPMIPAMIAVFISLIAAALYNYSTEGRQKAFIKSAFKQYLSPIVIEQLIANPAKLNLGGERRVISIYFSDVQGFTSLSEALSPEELTSVLNDYLSAMTDIIQEEGGTVDKYEGDAIIAFWNAPLDYPDHAIRAVRASLRCQEKLAEMRPAFKERTGKELYMRIGLNTGPAVVGNMGSKTRFDYTMLGDAVNLAARLEGVNKQFGTYTMISQNTLNELEGAFAVRELSRIAVVGKKIPVTVYEPMRERDFAARQTLFSAFATALEHYYQGHFEEARAIFAQLADSDPPSAKYLAQCERLIADPPQAWEGVWTMTEK